jgi:hypothetical protein
VSLDASLIAPILHRGAQVEGIIVDAARGLLHRSCGPISSVRKLAVSARAGLFRASPTLHTGLSTLAEYEALVLNQGQTGSCQGHRAAQGLWVACAAASSPLSFFPSPDGIYRDGRCVQRIPLTLGGQLPPLTDSGTTTTAIEMALSTCGVHAIQAEPSPSGYTDVDPSTIDREPRLDELEAESLALSTGEYAIDITDTTAALATMQAALDAGYPVWIDAFVDSVTDAWWRAPSQPLDAIAPVGDPSRGGHAILLVEMYVDSALNVTVSMLNSWGPGGSAPYAGACPNQTGHIRATSRWLSETMYSATVGKVVRS